MDCKSLCKMHDVKSVAKMLTKDEARRIAAKARADVLDRPWWREAAKERSMERHQHTHDADKCCRH
jgi:hypothetical protein